MLKQIRRFLQKVLSWLPEESEKLTISNKDNLTQPLKSVELDLNINQDNDAQVIAKEISKTANLGMNNIDPPEQSSLSDAFYLSDEQMSAFHEMNNSNHNLFITGKAGTGKSVLLKYFRDHTSKNVVVLAPTGIAAMNVEGQTIHAFFELSSSVQIEDDFKNKYYKEQKEKLINRLDAIIIDEISMVRADTMDAIDLCLQIGRKQRGVPFGGCQIIAFGDLFQLPPVEPLSEDAKRYYRETYNTLFFFGAPAVKQAPFRIIELTQVFRQKDPVFVDLLNQIRVGEGILKAIERLNELCADSALKQDGVVVSPWKKQVKYINESNLNQLPGQEQQYHANAYGSFIKDGEIDASKMPADNVLRLKPGAKVMMLSNDKNKNWVNGTLAIVKEASQDNLTVIIKNKEYTVEKHIWEEYSYQYDSETGKIKKMISGAFEQYPVRLGYAITIHKSQGQTYDQVTVDYGNGTAFACGQTYVALSRCRSLDGLWLKTPLKFSDVKVNDEVVKWMKYHQRNTESSTESHRLETMHWSDEAYLIETGGR